MIDEGVSHKTSLKKDLLAIENLAYFALESAFPLKVTGADRLEFLHGQLSNTVKGLKSGGFNESLMLNHKGHALAQMTVCRREDDLFVVVEDGAGQLVQEQLQRHIIFDQVKLEPMSQAISSLSLQGKLAAELIKKQFGDLPAQGQFSHFPFEGAKVLVHPSKRSFAAGFDLHVLAKDAHKLVAELTRQGAEKVDQEVVDLARVCAGIPKASSEAGEGVLPQEAGLEFAVSYTKGCYLGQEIMARIEARGNLRRGLVGLRLSQMPSSKEIYAAGKAVGKLGKVVNHPEFGLIALAILRNDLNANASLNIGDAQATLTLLPFEPGGV